MEAIRQIHAVAPVQIGDVLFARDAAGTGADIVATKNIPVATGFRRTDPKMLQINLKKNADALRHKKLFLLDMDGRSIMKIQFLKERWIFFPRLKKKMEDAIFSLPIIPPNP